MQCIFILQKQRSFKFETFRKKNSWETVARVKGPCLNQWMDIRITENDPFFVLLAHYFEVQEIACYC